MIGLEYSLVIEATEKPDYFRFYSPDLEGFTVIGHSIEDYIYKAKWGMRQGRSCLLTAIGNAQRHSWFNRLRLNRNVWYISSHSTNSRPTDHSKCVVQSARLNQLSQYQLKTRLNKMKILYN